MKTRVTMVPEPVRRAAAWRRPALPLAAVRAFVPTGRIAGASGVAEHAGGGGDMHRQFRMGGGATTAHCMLAAVVISAVVAGQIGFGASES